MKCYNHHERDAFGIDTTTGKALCLECLEDYKGRIIERNNEHSKVRVDLTDKGYGQINENEKVIQHNEKIMYFNEKSIKATLKYSKTIGIITAIFAILSFVFISPSFIGAIFLILSLLCFLSFKICKECTKEIK